MNSDQEMNRKIKQAFTNATPDILDSVLADCKEQKGNITMTTLHDHIDTTKNRPSHPDTSANTARRTGSWLKPILSIAAALLLVIGGHAGLNTYHANHSVASTVILDVNPSIEIQVNGKEKVLAVIARNEDAEIIVGDMDFAGSNLDVTINALIGSMLRNGYLSEISNSILISVDGKDAAETAALQAKLTEEINQLLQTDTFSGAVLSQTISADTELQSLADTYGITLGKAQLIRQIISKNPAHTFEELVSLSIHELNLISSSSSAPLEQVESVGTASVKAYIGEDNAWAIALTHARLTAADISDCYMEMDYELGAFVYELEFHCGDHDYEYYIHATDGSVVTHDKERCDEKHDHDKHHHGPYDVMPIPSEESSPADSTQAAPTETSAPAPTSPAAISDAEAKGFALAHAGASEQDIYDYYCDLDEDDGILIYEIEFSWKGYDYDYEVDAVTGEIREFDKERDDDIAR